MVGGASASVSINGRTPPPLVHCPRYSSVVHLCGIEAAKRIDRLKCEWCIDSNQCQCCASMPPFTSFTDAEECSCRHITPVITQSPLLTPSRQLSLSRCDSRSKLMSPTCAGLLVGPGELWRPDTVPIPWQDHCRCHPIAHDEVAPDEFSSHGKATCRPE